MNTKADTKAIGIIIATAVAILLGVVLVQVISNLTETNTSLTTTTETVNIAPARLAANAINTTYYFHLTNGCPGVTGWRSDLGSECEIVNGGIKNSSGSALIDPTDVVFISNGAICTGVNSGDLSFVSSARMEAQTSNTTTVTYSYCAPGYISGWAATTENLVPGFFILAILIGTAFVIFYVLKEQGLV